jgi:hypothetical protein
MRDTFCASYERPESKHVLDLILRCSELYLTQGLWWDLCHGEIRLRERQTDEPLSRIRSVFYDANVGDRYSISSPIIELTLTRLEMMTFFRDKQEDMLARAQPIAMDPLSDFHVTLIGPIDEAEIMLNATFPGSITSPDSLALGDDEYLHYRENVAWAYFRSLRLIGSVFSLLYYGILAIIAIVELSNVERQLPVVECFSTGLTLFVVISEILSLRVCHVGSCRPNEIPYLYPGIEFYFMQYIAVSFGEIVLFLAMLADKLECSTGSRFLAFHQLIALIAPWLLLPCAVERHRRGDRVFKWLRLAFFQSWAWLVVRVVFFVFLTPGIYGLQVLIAYNLKNKPAVVRSLEEVEAAEP